MKKILVPTDFSKPATIAYEVALSIAKKAGAEVTLLHVIEQPGTSALTITGEVMQSSFEDQLFTMKLIQKSKQQLEKMASISNGVTVKTDLKVGNAFRGMRDIITSKDVDLVVMGTSGRSAFEEVVIGSNTEKVVRHSKCPVLTVHKKPASLNFKHIVYATSMHKDEEVFSKIVRKAQEMYGSKLHLLRVNTPGNFQRDDVTRKQMELFAKKLNLKNFTINIYNDITEEEGIIRFSETINASMVALATHGRTGFAHLMAGSIAEDVVNHAKRPVLTFVVKKRK
ncbi:MAG TPA: universal stress protein [Cyclobacteriaceae bacterium]|nr:universal stress protein [Cyclobacteriaceae bacterium]